MKRTSEPCWGGLDQDSGVRVRAHARHLRMTALLSISVHTHTQARANARPHARGLQILKNNKVFYAEKNVVF